MGAHRGLCGPPCRCTRPLWRAGGAGGGGSHPGGCGAGSRGRVPGPCPTGRVYLQVTKMQGNKGFNMEKQNHAPRKQHQQHPPPAIPANGQQNNSQSESRARRGEPPGPALGRRRATASGDAGPGSCPPVLGQQVSAETARTRSFGLEQ